MEDLVARKSALRAEMLRRRAQDHGRGLDAAANARLISWIGSAEGSVVAGYMPIRTELSPLHAMTVLSDGATVAVPVVIGAGEALVFHKWTPEGAMVPGAFGAAVPESAIAVVPDVVIVPLVAFDAQRGRLGYGGGFYDRTLERLRAANPSLRVVGFAFDVQEAEAIPLEATDQPLDAIITPTRIL